MSDDLTIPPRPATDRPNIILVNCDDLGYGDLGCYGSERNRTPNLDRMAEEGLRLTDFYMMSPVCSPSRAAMLTGCYPQRVGITRVLNPGDAIGLHPDERSIASILKDRGYATQIVGKWHVGDQPEFLPDRHGFDDYFGIPYSNDMGRMKGFPETIPPLPLLDGNEVIQQQPEQEGLTERYVERAVRFIRDHRDEPFFVYFAHMHVHRPILVARRFMETTRNGRYGAAVEAIDWSVGVLLHELRRLGLDEHTMVVFTSDNGSRGDLGGSNAPLQGGKFTTYEGGMRLPCIVRWPGQVPAGRVSKAVTTSMDFLPTFARAAGAEVPDDRIIDGRDITDVLRGSDDAEGPEAIFYYGMRNVLSAVRSGRWKLHVGRITLSRVRNRFTVDSSQVVELYDLETDIGETDDVAADHPEVVARLQALLADCRKDLGDALTEVQGENRRPAGRVENPQPLTRYDPEHPYVWAEYDTAELG